MNLSVMNSGTTFGALKPLGEYKGPILKLTKADKEKIAKYEKQIAQLDIEIMKLNNYAQSRGTGVNHVKNFTVEEYGSDYFNDQLFNLADNIDSLKKMIKQIKMNRLEKQKAKLTKKAQNAGNLDVNG